MNLQRHKLIELLAILLVIAGAIGIAAWSRLDHQPSRNQIGASTTAPIAASPTATTNDVIVEATPTQEHPIPTTETPATRQPSSTPAVELPDDATLGSSDEAIARALGVAHSLGADAPHVVAADVRSLVSTLMALHSAAGESDAKFANDLEGWPTSALEAATWVVQLDGDTFGSLSCLPETACGGASTIVIVLDPTDASVISMNWGLELPLRD